MKLDWESNRDDLMLKVVPVLTALVVWAVLIIAFDGSGGLVAAGLAFAAGWGARSAWKNRK